MTEEDIKVLQDAKEAAETRAQEAEQKAADALAAAEKSKGDVDNIVAELTEERRKKNEAIEKQKLQTGDIDINEVIQSAFKEKEEAQRKSDFQTALSEFQASKPEFQADSAGIVFSKFKEGLSRFNFSDVSTKEQAKARLEEAYRFLSPSKEGDDEPSYSGSSSNPAPVRQNAQESDNDKRAIESTGMDEARYKALKAKYGDAFSSLGLN